MNKKYTIVFKDSAPQSEKDKVVARIQAAGGEIVHLYDSLNGFAATVPDNYLQTLQGLRLQDGAAVDYISEPPPVPYARTLIVLQSQMAR
ncbi:hypothetical protein RhiJN_21815 [Ceratobasidium sp. AG-Ba]|nr:hypothetical protein RhiJN_21815 [Ceratobasidium sp. AG-Ba]